jgi:LacI family transcriptional regulator
VIVRRKIRSNPPQVAIMVPTWNHYGRGIVEGIWQYAQQHGPWLLDLQPAEPDKSTRVPEGWHGDGIIALIHSEKLADKLARFKVPVVNVSGTGLRHARFPCVTSNPDAVVAMAVAHLREKGFRNIAFCGEPEAHFTNFWTEAFVRVREAEGETPLVYRPVKAMRSDRDMETLRQDRQRWLTELPKPVGVVGWDTNMCRHLAIACSLAAIDVPAQVALVSLETEDLLGRTVHPPISGVDIPVERIGIEAARQLDLLLLGERPTPTRVLLDPLGVTTRQSSDVVACDDPRVRQALSFIRNHADTGIGVADVLRAVPMARRSLERRFAQLLGYSPAEAIRATKVERVRQLLLTTEIPIPQIAEVCGFNYVEHMIPVFKKYCGRTPAQYRKHARRSA